MKIYTVTYKTGVSKTEGTMYKTLYYADIKKALQMTEELVNNPSKADDSYGIAVRTINAE